jgi:hypothetical protein
VTHFQALPFLVAGAAGEDVGQAAHAVDGDERVAG